MKPIFTFLFPWCTITYGSKNSSWHWGGINGREFICSIEIVCKIYEISVVLYSIKADALQVLRYAT